MNSGRQRRGIGAATLAFALLRVMLLSACSNSESSVQADGGMSPLAASIYDCSSPLAAHYLTIRSYRLKGLQYHSPTTYHKLTTDAMNAVLSATRALDARNLDLAIEAAKAAQYSVAPLVADGQCYWLLQPRDIRLGEQAIMIYAPNWTRDLVIEAPHASDDRHTLLESTLLFSRLHAKALLISGSKRCAVNEPSFCRKSNECRDFDGNAVESDPAHSVYNALNAMHLAFRDTNATVLQLHTNQYPAINGDALISNGTSFAAPGSPADAFYRALRGLHAPDVEVRSCNDPAHPLPNPPAKWCPPVEEGQEQLCDEATMPPPPPVCGQTNVQGLASNGAADTCMGRASEAGTAAGGRFVHLEQNTWRLCSKNDTQSRCIGDDNTWTALIGDALEKSVPVVSR